LAQSGRRLFSDPTALRTGSRRALVAVAELVLVAVWTLTVARDYLDLDANVAPRGVEYFTSIQSHFLWERALDCGLCALWNGNVQGGYPALAETHDAALHPVVIVATLLFGALNGAKFALVAILFLGGLAQWWLAYELGLSRAARLWSGGMAVAAGGYAGRMDQGVYAVVVSTVAAALCLPPLLRFARSGRVRDAAILGIALGLLLVSGQGYIQIGVAMLSPLVLLLAAASSVPIRLLARRSLLSLAIGGLFAAPFLVPLLHFFPSFGKFTDPSFAETQPFKFVPLNLVIDDPAFFHETSLGRSPFAYLFINYVGWTAVVLAGIGCAVLVRKDRWLTAFLVGWAVGAMWIASAMPLRWLRDATATVQPAWEFIVGIRNPALIAGLTTPALLALSAIGLDHLWRRVISPLRLVVQSHGDVTARPRTLVLDPRWLLALVLVWALLDARSFARTWLQVTTQVSAEIDPMLDALQTESAAWVSPPFGERYWVGAALARNMKLSSNVTVWHWKDRQDPQPLLMADRFGIPEGMTPAGAVGDVGIYAGPPSNAYARILHDDGTETACHASGRGGNVTVRCDAERPGRLIVQEHWFDGWSARLDGHATDISRAGDWIGTDVPAGESTIVLRYRPLDAEIGFALFAIGLVLAGYCLIRGERALSPIPVRVGRRPPLPATPASHA